MSSLHFNQASTLLTLLMTVVIVLLLVLYVARKISQFHLILRRHYYEDRYPHSFQFEVNTIINSWERRTRLNLSWAARQMLMIPITEQVVEGERLNFDEVDRSIGEIFEAIREEPRRRAEITQENLHNSVSVIRAFSKKFCNIPPFCSPKEG